MLLWDNSCCWGKDAVAWQQDSLLALQAPVCCERRAPESGPERRVQRDIKAPVWSSGTVRDCCRRQHEGGVMWHGNMHVIPPLADTELCVTVMRLMGRESHGLMTVTDSEDRLCSHCCDLGGFSLIYFTFVWKVTQRAARRPWAMNTRDAVYFRFKVRGHPIVHKSLVGTI